MARLLDEYPDVFDAYWVQVAQRLQDAPGAKRARRGLRDRRESTRAERIRNAGRRK